MPRFIIELSFDGSDFHGWQMQPNRATVQQTIENALKLLLDPTISVTGCGRTDTGVHASYYVAHFDTDILFDEVDITFKINKFFDHKISVFEIKKTGDEFHARFKATQRQYTYFVATGKEPFFAHYSWYLPIPLNVELMNLAAGILCKVDDFTSFSKLHSNTKNNICHVSMAGWEKSGNFLVFTISADRFLRNMVRAIVGTLIEVGKGKISLEQFCEIIEAKNRCASGQSIPAQGLFLSDVVYPENLLVRTRKLSFPLIKEL